MFCKVEILKFTTVCLFESAHVFSLNLFVANMCCLLPKIKSVLE